MKLSVIIPVYNTAPTLERCVRSVAEQEGVSLEIILVDDGSTDSSAELCDRLAERDGRIIVIHKSNGGLSDARNRGIEMTTGGCLTFVDSDDCVAQATYKNAVGIMEAHPEYGFVEFPALRHCGSRHESKLSFDDREYADMRGYWLSARAYDHSYAWNKVYRRELFSDVRFPVGRLFEDVHMLPLLLKKAKIVATTSRGQYFYYANPQGITATADAQAHRDLLDAHIRLLHHFDFLTAREQNYYMHILNIQITENELTGDAPRLPYKRISVCRVDKRFRLKALLLCVLGVKGLCRCNRMLRRVMPRKLS